MAGVMRRVLCCRTKLSCANGSKTAAFMFSSFFEKPFVSRVNPRMDRYLRKELAAWAKRFPGEFNKERFRLRSWQRLSISGKRPGIVGTYTNDLVYERLAPGILQELEA